MEKAVHSDCERATVYKILAECYYCPDEPLLKLLDDAPEATGDFLSEITRNAPHADDLERHTVDYTKLFVGPFKLLAAPYGSVYLEDGKFMSESTLSAKDFYEQEGLDIVLKDAPDHINVELEFMYFLVLKEAEARENSDLTEATRLHDEQASFLQMHLGRWAGPFAENIKKHSQTEFYKALGREMENFVQQDLEKF